MDMHPLLVLFLSFWWLFVPWFLIAAVCWIDALRELASDSKLGRRLAAWRYERDRKRDEKILRWRAKWKGLFK